MNGKRELVIAVVVAVVVAGCGIPQEKYDADIAALKSQIVRSRHDLNTTKQRLAEMANEKQMLEKELAALRMEMKRLAGERDANAAAVAQAQERIETFRNMLAKFRSMIESGKIKVKIVNNRMLVEMASAILFPSGKSKLSEEGGEALAEVAAILSTINGRNFQVAGHTDNIPINNARFKSNWELSSARAVAVVEHLIENGMAMENVSAAGYGDTQPVASNDTDEGRAQNRRIEIVLLPNLDELPDLSSLEGMSN